MDFRGRGTVQWEGAWQAIREARKRDCLTVSKLDRLSGDLRDILALVDDELGHCATLISVSEEFDARAAAGRAFLQLLGSFGEFERGRTQERTRDALAKKRREEREQGTCRRQEAMPNGRAKR